MTELNKLLAQDLNYFSKDEFRQKYCYDGTLGYEYSKESTVFKVWTPVASKVWVNLYSEDAGDNLLCSYEMVSQDKGLWVIDIKGDLEDKYYTYTVQIDNLEEVTDKSENNEIDYRYTDEDVSVVFEVADIYGNTSGANGNRTMIVDMAKTNPEGWEHDKAPKLDSILDSIIYEVHVRDFSSDKSAGVNNAKRYKAFTEKGTKNDFGLSTGIDHLKELGVTHIHLLPIQDYATVDEDDIEPKKYNWGYDPLNYYVPEGSYATDAHDGKVRIREFKELVKTCHENGIRVVMDVVYNHTYSVRNSLYNRLVPNYYHRIEDGLYTDGSACGNETASEHYMFSKYMIDSLKYYIEEYHIDGFRFDLMAVHDIETMNKIRKMVDAIDTSIILYGEGWKGGYSKLNPTKAAFKLNASKLNNIAMFNDDGRDAVKGCVFEAGIRGFATGAMYDESVDNKDAIVNKVKFMIVGSGEHDQIKHIDMPANPTEGLGDNVVFWADKASKSINYISAHDNLTLWDKIQVSNKNESLETKIKMDKLSMAIVMLSEGIPFIHAGDEFLRSKEDPNTSLGYDDNSYMSSDEINGIKWNDKYKYLDVFNYYKGLIEFRKSTKELKYESPSLINSQVRFYDTSSKGVILYSLNDREDILIGFNGDNTDYNIELEPGVWEIFVNEEKAGTDVLATVEKSVSLRALSAIVLRKKM